MQMTNVNSKTQHCASGSILSNDGNSRKKFIGEMISLGFLSSIFPANALVKPIKDFYDLQNGRIFDTRIHSFLPADPEKLIHKHLEQRFFCVGESHTHPLHHWMQLKMVEALKYGDEERPLAIGLEMFYRQHQEALDRFVFRQGSLEQLKRETNWDQTWGFSFSSYCKIFKFAQRNGIRLVGLNAPSPVIALVGSRGLDKLPPQLKELLPEVDLSNVNHRRRFMSKIQSFGGMHGPLSEERLQHMYEAQTLWDEYMAESASKHLSKTKTQGGRMIILAGTNHIEARDGIPDRITRRIDEPSFTMIPQDVEWTEVGLPAIDKPLDREYGDWIFYTQKQIEDA